MKTNSGNNNEVIVLQGGPESEKIPQYRQTIPVNIYHFYIIDEIGETHKYLDLINTLKTAEEHDTIFIYLNTPGGILNTAIQIISAMNQCNGTVVTCLEGEVCSAGTLIFLSGDRHIINPNCTFMIHNYSQRLGGKGNEISSQIRYNETYFKKLATQIYGGFLTEDEIELLIEGKDYWMDSDEVARRLGIDLEEPDTGDVSSLMDETVNNVTEQVSDKRAKPEANEKVFKEIKPRKPKQK